MGLDAFFYSCTNDNSDEIELGYFRKVNWLQGWMEDQYCNSDQYDVNKYESYGFNGIKFYLDVEKLDQLENDILNDRVSPRAGFFFGPQEVRDDDVQNVLYAIQRCKKALHRGLKVYYDSSW